MCGIVGIINQKASKSFNHNDIALNRIFDDLLWADQLRGMDGTGIMKMDKEYKIDTLKVAGGWTSIASEKGYDKIKNWVDSAFFTVGHNRSATKGKAIAANAHPFSEGPITLVHNGTLTYFPDKYGHAEKDLDVDSKALTKMIAELGIEGAVNEFNGAYACVWFDSTDHSINIARNYERPLGFIKYDGGIVFASEPHLAAWCASRNGKNPTEMGIFDTNTHYKIRADDLSNVIIKKYTPKPPTTYSTPIIHSGTGGWVDKTPRYPQYDLEDEDEAAASVILPTVVTGKGSSKKDKKDKKEGKFSPINTMVGENGYYSIGDPVIVRLDSFKSNPQSSFYQISGTIIEPLAEGIRHKILGNICTTFEKICDLEQIYEGRISAISKSPTGFYLVNLRDIEKVSDLKEKAEEVSSQVAAPAKELPKSNIVPFRSKEDASKIKDLQACECCNTLFEVSEIKPFTNEFRRDDGSSLRRVLKVCEVCEIRLKTDVPLFDLAYDKKLERLRRRGVVV